MELVIGMVGMVASLFGLYKLVTEVTLYRFGKRRDEYDFSRKFISDLDDPSIHRLTLEKGFLTLAGKIYPVEEIRLLLTSEMPSQSIKERASATRYVRFNPETNNYCWKGVFGKTFVRNHALKWYFFWYTVTASLALIPFYIKGVSAFGELSIVMFSGSLFFLAVMCLVSGEEFKSARRLISRFGHE